MTYPRVVSISDPSSNSLSRAVVQPLTPDTIEAFGNIEYAQEGIFARMVESRAVGVVANSLTDLLMSRITQVDKAQLAKRTIGRQSITAPFKYRTRERNFGSTYFQVTAGAVSTRAGTTVSGVVHPNSTWKITVTSQGAGLPRFQSAVADPVRYFNPGNYITVEHRDIGSPYTARTVTFKILSTSSAATDSCEVHVAAPFDNAYWGVANTAGNIGSVVTLAGDASSRAPWQPALGTISLLSNNVSDYEGWNANLPVNNTEELLIDYFQTSRFTRARTAEYEAMLLKIMRGEVNQYLKTFRYLDAAKRNKIEMQEYQKQWNNSLWFGSRISNNQVYPTLASPNASPSWANVQALDQAVDPENGALYEYKANAIGIRTQLADWGRVSDLQNAQLDLNTLIDQLYVIKRNRTNDGKPHDRIDILVDRKTAQAIGIKLNKYLKDTAGVTPYIDVKGGVAASQQSLIGFDFNVYDIPRESFQLCVFTHPFFDDRIDAFQNGSGGIQGGTNIQARGRMIMAIDWNDINIGVVETNKVRREYKGETTANANSLWKNVMKMNTETYDLESTTWDVELGDHARHFIWENFQISAIADVTAT